MLPRSCPPVVGDLLQPHKPRWRVSGGTEPVTEPTSVICHRARHRPDSGPGGYTRQPAIRTDSPAALGNGAPGRAREGSAATITRPEHSLPVQLGKGCLGVPARGARQSVTSSLLPTQQEHGGSHRAAACGPAPISASAPAYQHTGEAGRAQPACCQSCLICRGAEYQCIACSLVLG